MIHISYLINLTKLDFLHIKIIEYYSICPCFFFIYKIHLYLDSFYVDNKFIIFIFIREVLKYSYLDSFLDKDIYIISFRIKNNKCN